MYKLLPNLTTIYILFLFSALPNTKGKIFFKNLRLRCKLRNNEKLETPKVIDEKIERCSRFRRFINFFKFGRSKSSFFMSRLKRNRKIGPVKTNLSIGYVNESCNNDSSEIIDVDEVPWNRDTVQISVKDDKKNSENTSVNVCKEDCESGQDVDSEKSLKEGGDFFNQLNAKISEIDKKRKLAPILGAKLKNIKLESEIYHNQFYSANFKTEDDVAESRPSTAKPPTEYTPKSKALTEEGLKLRQIRANELRAQATEKRIQAITARRERFEKNKVIMDEAKQRKIKNSRDARKKRREQVFLNKSRINIQRIEVL